MTALQIAAVSHAPSYTQLLTEYDAEEQTLWYYLNPAPRPCFTSTLLHEILDLQARVARQDPSLGGEVRYLVLASAQPGTFNLGGDLDLFRSLIMSRDRDALTAYAVACIDAVYRNATGTGRPDITTISLIQGTALGGGFEAAISSHVIVAERSTRMGTPEILFNLFPGMGAYSLLSRRVGMVEAERILTTGSQYEAAHLHARGVVDVLVEDGEGIKAVRDYIRRHRRAQNGRQAIQRVRQRIHPIPYEELLDVTMIWVDAALRLTDRDLRMMERLVAAQQRLGEDTERWRTHPAPGVLAVRDRAVRELSA